jgi:hypothetical protein
VPDVRRAAEHLLGDNGAEVVALVASMARSLDKELPQDAGGERGHPRRRDINQMRSKATITTFLPPPKFRR